MAEPCYQTVICNCSPCGVGQTHAFTPYKASLDPETMQAAVEAFELAWAEVMARPDSQDAPACRDLLAKRIIDAALEHNERDPERLKAYALEGFNP